MLLSDMVDQVFLRLNHKFTSWLSASQARLHKRVRQYFSSSRSLIIMVFFLMLQLLLLSFYSITLPSPTIAMYCLLLVFMSMVWVRSGCTFNINYIYYAWRHLFVAWRNLFVASRSICHNYSRSFLQRRMARASTFAIYTNWRLHACACNAWSTLVIITFRFCMHLFIRLVQHHAGP